MPCTGLFFSKQRNTTFIRGGFAKRSLSSLWKFLTCRICPIWAGGTHTCVPPSFRYYSKSGGELKQNITMKRHAYSWIDTKFCIHLRLWCVHSGMEPVEEGSMIQVTTVIIYAKICWAWVSCQNLADYRHWFQLGTSSFPKPCSM